LIVKLSSIGDVVMATPVARALREAMPNAYIAWVVEPKSADIVVGNPYLDEVIIFDRPKSSTWPSEAARFLWQARELKKRLRERHFDVALDLQGLLRSAVVMALSGAPVRLGYKDAREFAPLLYTRALEPDPLVSIQQRHLNLLAPLGIRSQDVRMTIPISADDRQFAEDFFKKNGLNAERTVALCPATSQPIKHWFNDRWANLAGLLWHEHGIRGIVLGSGADVRLAEDIRNKSEAPLVVAAGLTTLKQAGALMERCLAVVGVDTGLLHIGVALDKPSVGLFGPLRWTLLAQKDNFIWLAKDLPCSPCRHKPTCDGRIDCMRAITPEDVMQALGPWLPQRASSRVVR